MFKKVGVADRSKLGLCLSVPDVLSCTFYSVESKKKSIPTKVKFLEISWVQNFPQRCKGRERTFG